VVFLCNQSNLGIQSTIEGRSIPPLELINLGICDMNAVIA